MWRLWAAMPGSAVGALVALALGAGGSALLLGAVAGILATGALASLLAHRADPAPGRGLHLARGASAGWVALPALAAVLLDLGPATRLLAAAATVWLAFFLWRAVRADGPAPGLPGIGLAGLAHAALGALAVTAAAGAWAAAGGTGLRSDDALRAASFDVDSRVPLAPVPACRPRLAHMSTLASPGSRPRLGPGDRDVWFEAPGPDGRMQVQRVARAGGPVRCWTCAEPGNNRHPAPHPSGTALLYDTDRFASWLHPRNTEVMVGTTRGGDRPVKPGRRLTYDPASDDHALYEPSGRGFVWTHGGDGRFDVMSATLNTGHGGVVLSGVRRLLGGGAGWVEAAHWSPDARTLVGVRGHPLHPMVASAYDPALGTVAVLSDEVAPGVPAATSADGSMLAVATTASIGAAHLLPSFLGFALARVTPEDPIPGLLQGTEVRWGPRDGSLAEVDLGDVASWGVPTGIALGADGRGFVLGQRREDAERILWIDLDCAGS